MARTPTKVPPGRSYTYQSGPQLHQKKSRCFSVVVFEIAVSILVFCMITNMALNYWQRQTIRKQLSFMKLNLHNLKDATKSIGSTYDYFQQEIISLMSKYLKIFVRKETDDVSNVESLYSVKEWLKAKKSRSKSEEEVESSAPTVVL